MKNILTHPIRTAALGAFLTMAVPAQGVPGGQIRTMPTGQYNCEMAGDILIEARRRVPDQDFKVLSSSSYNSANGRGIYLLTGDLLVMTSGPMKGTKFRRKSHGFLRQLTNQGEETEVRCIHTAAF